MCRQTGRSAGGRDRRDRSGAQADLIFQHNCLDELSLSKILEKVFADKKFVDGKIRFVVTPRLGCALLADNMTIEDLESGLQSDRTIANVTRKEAFIALNMVPHLGPVRLRRLLDIFGSPSECCRQNETNCKVSKD